MQIVSVLTCFLSVWEGNQLWSGETPAEFVRDERTRRGLVNADQETALLKQEQLRVLEAAFERNGYAEFDRSRQSFESAKAFRTYKNICRKIAKVKRESKYFQQRAMLTEARIQEFCNQFVHLSDFLRRLQYSDKNGQLHDLTIFVNSGSLRGNFRVAETKFQLSDQDELYYPISCHKKRKHAVSITLDKRSLERDGLLHEIGHVLALAADPRAYYRLLRERPCDFDCQKNTKHPVAMLAIQLQQWGIQQKK